MLRAKLRIRSTIVVMFAVLTFPLFFAIVALNYSSNEEAARSNAYVLIERFHDEANDSIESLLTPIKSMITSATVVGNQQADFYTSNRSLQYLLSILHHSNKIFSIYVGREDGSFRQARQVSADVKIQGKLPPPDVKYAYRWIEADGKPLIDRYSFLNAKDQPIGTSEAPTLYDPRSRLWYQQTVSEHQLIITDPEVFAALGLIGFTIAAPIYNDGRITGVAAADLTLDGLSQFLAEHKISKGTLSYILNARNEVMASSDGAQTYEDNGSQVSLRHITGMNGQLPSVAFSTRPRDGGADQPYEFTFEGKTYVASWATTSKNIGKNWQFFTITPLEDFTAVFDKNNRNLLFWGALVIIIDVLAMYLLAKTISKPLERLATNVGRIERLEIDKVETLDSKISEISVLVKAIDTLGSTVESFAAFVPIGLVRQLVGSNRKLELGGHSRFLTIFFSDLEAFSTLSEEVPTQELMRRVSAYLELVTHAINAENGTIDKFIGDGVMAFWGAPALLDQHALHACLAALRIQHEMDALNERWKADDYKPLRVRIGMHSDAVLVGNIGCRERVGYTVMGDGVNVAARLEGVNKQYGTRICISHSVFKEAGERLCVRPIDEVTVKGRRGKIAIYELLGAYGAGPELEPDAAIEQLCSMTRSAHQALIQNDLELARARYEEILVAFPGDRVATELLKRLVTTDSRRIPSPVED